MPAQPVPAGKSVNLDCFVARTRFSHYDQSYRIATPCKRSDHVGEYLNCAITSFCGSS